MTAPDVLFQAHSSALAVTFYDQAAFPAEYRGDAFVTLHGSHTRPERTGYKVVRVRMRDGQPTGEYADFLTGFLVDNFFRAHQRSFLSRAESQEALRFSRRETLCAVTVRASERSRTAVSVTSF